MTNFYDSVVARRHAADWLFAALSDGRHYTYGDVEAVSAHFANVLTDCGVAAGDRVAVQVPKSIEALMLYLATLRVGAVFLPLNTGYTPREVEAFLLDAAPRLFVCDPEARAELRPVAERAGARLETLGVWRSPDISAGTLADRGLDASASFVTVPRNADDLAALLYTSGTTGRSKGAMLTHENLRSNAAALMTIWRFTAADTLLHALPIFHTHGLFVATNITLLAGCRMLFLPRFDADEVIDHLPQASVMMGVPTFYTRLLATPRLTAALAAHMRLFVSGSAPLAPETHALWRARTGHAILERYGMTETGMITSNPYDGERRAGTVGFPLPGVALRIADPATGEHLPDGEIGMIEVKGPNVFKGYWRQPDKTAAEFRHDGFFITGDLGMRDEQSYVHIVGRGKDLIITGGLNVYPREIENAIDEIPGVAESAVIGIAHPDFGEGVTALVVPAAGATLDEKSVLAALQPRLARFKLPKRVLVVPELPRNAMGKIEKAVLRKAHADLYAG
ncbi:MAG: malonyl-CoA synthase [Aestuariivirgaceae bacterium]